MSLFRKLFGLPPKHKHDWHYVSTVQIQWATGYETQVSRKCKTCQGLDSTILNGYWTLESLNA
jgi:hypothetical protein